MATVTTQQTSERRWWKWRPRVMIVPFVVVFVLLLGLFDHQLVVVEGISPPTYLASTCPYQFTCDIRNTLASNLTQNITYDNYSNHKPITQVVFCSSE